MGERTGNGTHTVQACASCKYQRRKCQKDCFLAPYFPANRYEDFQIAHKLFGVSNIVKILNTVEAHDRVRTTESIIEQAKKRKEDPVHGCLGAIHKLMNKIEAHKKELHFVKQQLYYLKQQQQLQMVQQQFGSYNYPPLAPINLSNEILNLEGLRNLDVGSNYFPALPEYEAFKLLNIKPINQVGNTFHQNTGTAIFKDSEKSSTESSLTEKPSFDPSPDNVATSAFSNFVCKEEDCVENCNVLKK